MAESGRIRAVWPAIAMLIGVAGLSVWVIGAPPRPVPAPVACGELSALPIQPLGVEYPAFTLVAFGRSSMNLAPGDTLCLALGWRNGPESVDGYRLRVDVQRGADSGIGGYQGPLAGPEGWEPFFQPVEYYALRIDPDAPTGTYNLIVTVLLGDEALRDPVAIGAVRIVEKTGGAEPLQGGQIDYEGELQPQPFIPTEAPTEEDV